MLGVIKKKSKIVAILVAVVFLVTTPLYAAQELLSIQPRLFEKALQLAGMKTQFIDLDRDDGFEQAVLIEGIYDEPILVVFPPGGIREGIPFVIEIDGSEAIVVISEEGRPVIIHQDRDVTDVLSLIICFLSAINNALIQLQQCTVDPRCTLVAVLTLIINIVQCGR
jgi:hypothetical protein